MENFNYAEIESKIGYAFENKSLLKQAFTRSSYAAEKSCEDNEVLEFIGDSVLGAIVAKRLSFRYFWSKQKENAVNALVQLRGITFSELSPNQEFVCLLDENEGELSQLKMELVQRASLAAATERMGLQQYLQMSEGDVKGNVAEEASVKEDLFEAIVGAVAIDCGWDFEVLEELVETMLEIERLLEEGFPGEPDYEAELVEWLEEHGVPADFKEIPTACMEVKHAVFVDLGVNMFSHRATGYGNSEKGARRMAAKKAIAFIKKTVSNAQAIEKAVGLPDRAKAINQLQELWQKKLIPEPQYTCTKDTSNVKNGNPMWRCGCKLEGIYEVDSCVSETQTEGKKAAAYEVLRWLLGTDLMSIISGKEAPELDFLGEKKMRLKEISAELLKLKEKIDRAKAEQEQGIKPDKVEWKMYLKELILKKEFLIHEQFKINQLLHNLAACGVETESVLNS